MRTLAAVFVVSLCGCGPLEATVDEPGDVDAATEAGLQAVPGLRGHPLALDVAQWNVMWLGNTSFGPTDEAGQTARVANLIRSANVDLWALQEVASQDAFDALVRAVPGASGLAATDPRVADGLRFYSSQEQRPALLFKTRAVRVRSARLVLTADATTFAGRPPLEAQLTVTINRQQLDLTVVVVHLKAGPGLDDRDRREQASALLAAHVATLTGPTLVLGDWNDSLGRSIAGPKLASPFANFTPTDGTWLTRKLEDAGLASSVFGSFIDHALATPSLAPRHQGSTVHDPRVVFPTYGRDTSDHFPVLHVFSM